MSNNNVVLSDDFHFTLLLYTLFFFYSHRILGTCIKRPYCRLSRDPRSFCFVLCVRLFRFCVLSPFEIYLLINLCVWRIFRCVSSNWIFGLCAGNERTHWMSNMDERERACIQAEMDFSSHVLAHYLLIVVRGRGKIDWSFIKLSLVVSPIVSLSIVMHST